MPLPFAERTHASLSDRLHEKALPYQSSQPDLCIDADLAISVHIDIYFGFHIVVCTGSEMIICRAQCVQCV